MALFDQRLYTSSPRIAPRRTATNFKKPSHSGPAGQEVEQRYYEAGHMMYVLESELVKLKANIAQLIATTSGR
jgi:carboxypeptidase C (cathepsin A)